MAAVQDNRTRIEMDTAQKEGPAEKLDTLFNRFKIR